MQERADKLETEEPQTKPRLVEFLPGLFVFEGLERNPPKVTEELIKALKGDAVRDVKKTT